MLCIMIIRRNDVSVSVSGSSVAKAPLAMRAAGVGAIRDVWTKT